MASSSMGSNDHRPRGQSNRSDAHYRQPESRTDREVGRQWWLINTTGTE
ncbi:hypothetical protein Pd630_LPD03798 [Rhodococcus opacus PD630]|nr:hypothetical protein Pd630_LPD03798 [Rhodococcus opacus PD630]